MEDIKPAQNKNEKIDHSKMDHSKMENSKMNPTSMSHGSNPSMGMEGHDHNIMIADYKKRFFVVLVLTLPIVLLSTMIQKFIGVHWQFPGSQYVLFGLSSIVFFYGG